MSAPAPSVAASGAPSSERRGSKLSRLRGHGSLGMGASRDTDGDGTQLTSLGASMGAPMSSPSSSSSAAASNSSSSVLMSVAPGPIVGALGRAAVPTIEPVVAHVAHVEPLTDVRFLAAGVVTADCVGNVKLWTRPAQQHVPPLSLTPQARSREGAPPLSVATAIAATAGHVDTAQNQRPGDLD
jgi:hypothetical protein